MDYYVCSKTTESLGHIPEVGINLRSAVCICGLHGLPPFWRHVSSMFSVLRVRLISSFKFCITHTTVNCVGQKLEHDLWSPDWTMRCALEHYFYHNKIIHIVQTNIPVIYALWTRRPTNSLTIWHVNSSRHSSPYNSAQCAVINSSCSTRYSLTKNLKAYHRLYEKNVSITKKLTRIKTINRGIVSVRNLKMIVVWSV
jgi:hypothetical protein